MEDEDVAEKAESASLAGLESGSRCRTDWRGPESWAWDEGSGCCGGVGSVGVGACGAVDGGPPGSAGAAAGMAKRLLSLILQESD